MKNINCKHVAVLILVGVLSAGCHTAVIHETHKGNIEGVKFWLDLGTDVRSYDLLTGDSSLRMAVEEGRIEIARLLLEHGANPIESTRKGIPMSLAVADGHDAIVSMILDKYPEQIDDPLWLVLAAKNGRASTTNLLLERGADVNQFYRSNCPVIASCEGFPLFHSVHYESRDKYYGPYYIAPRQDDRAVFTLDTLSLELCKGRDNTQVLRTLLACGANPNAATDNGSTALHFAAHYTRPTTSGGERAGLSLVRVLLDAGCSPNIFNKSGETPLHFAAKHGGIFYGEFTRDAIGMVTVLIEAGSQVNIADARGYTPLHAAVETYDFVNISKELKKGLTVIVNPEKDCYLNICEKRNWLGFKIRDMRSTIGNNSSVFEGPDWPGYAFCKERGLVDPYQAEVVHCLLDHEARINACDKKGETPLHKAARSGLYDMVDILLVAGADPSIKNDDGKTPANLAEENGFWDVVNRL